MKTIINVSIAFAVIITGIAWAQNAKPSALPAQPFQAGPTSRYQIVFGPHARADTFMLDTQTGRIWQRTHLTDVEGEPDIWLIQKRFDSIEDEITWGRSQTLKKKPE